MENVGSILNMLRTTFKPEVQGTALTVLKNNRTMLKSEKYAFVELPAVIRGTKEADVLEKVY